MEAKRLMAARGTFQTADFWGNTVTLSESTWTHILRGHPDMSGHSEAIEKAVKEPTIVSESTTDSEALIFDGYNMMRPSSRIVRVVVRYECRDNVKSGSTNGLVATAYGPLTASTGNVGTIIYFSGAARRTS